jgi:hypothetical protein
MRESPKIMVPGHPDLLSPDPEQHVHCACCLAHVLVSLLEGTQDRETPS